MPTTSSYLDNLNPVQKAAVTTLNGPVLVIAGPGSGKTRVLTFRIAHLIQSGVPPYQILALTFTNKAAREMKERISKVVGNRTNQVWAGTFHSIFARILRFEAEKIGFSSNFTIYDTQDTSNLISAIVSEMGLDPKAYETRGVKARISSAKSNLISPVAYPKNAQLMMQDKKDRRPYLHEIYMKYMMRCKRAGAMDFDDLLFQTFLLFHRNPENVLQKYRDKFKYLLVDEFQDTNYLQYRIIRQLVDYPGSPKNICVVGDDAQSIYAFRGATIQNILDFKTNYPKLKTFKLEQNYRSTHHIVQAANDLIAKNTNQIQKKIWTDKGDGQRIQVIRAVTDNEEAKRVADMILEQKTRYHLENKDVAILYRTNAQSRVFEEFLRRHNIAYKVFGGLSFYQRKEIKDLIAYLKLIVNPNDEEAIRRVINYPTRGIGKTTMDKVSKKANELAIPIWEVITNIGKHGFPARQTKIMRSFATMIEGFQRRLETDNAYEIAQHVSAKSGIADKLAEDKTVQGLSRRENLRGLLDGIKDFVEDDEVFEEATISDKSLTTYLQNIALLTDQDSKEETDDYVTLMSVHSAKGLEFKSVFMVGMENELFPSKRSRSEHGGIEEERRLFYVAITRAEEYLTLSFAKSRYRFGNIVHSEPSMFLDEISADNLTHPIQTFSHHRPETGPRRSGVAGMSKLKSTHRKSTPSINPADFQPSPPREIIVGRTVQHLRFGKGKVIAVEGGAQSRMAIIQFAEVGEKRIMMKYAKLQVVKE